MRLWNEDPEFIDDIFDSVYTHIAWSEDCTRQLKIPPTQAKRYMQLFSVL